jgi:replicative DNA helicase
MTVEFIGLRISQLKKDNRIGLAVVDYLQLATGAPGSQNREQEVASIAKGLRTIAKQTRIPIIALSQLNEEGKTRESRAISHESNIFIEMLSLEGEDGPPRMKVKKGRKIPKGSYDLEFESEYGRLKSATIKTGRLPHED